MSGTPGNIGKRLYIDTTDRCRGYASLDSSYTIYGSGGGGGSGRSGGGYARGNASWLATQHLELQKLAPALLDAATVAKMFDVPVKWIANTNDNEGRKHGMDLYEYAVIYVPMKDGDVDKPNAKVLVELTSTLGTSVDNVKRKALREFTDDVDLDDVRVLVRPFGGY